MSDAVDGCAGDGVPRAGGLEAGAGELVALGDLSDYDFR